MTNLIQIDNKLLSRLPAEKLANRLMAIPASDRLNVLLNRQDAESVVAAMPEQDFYIFVKEIGGESATPLLALAKLEQINHILDLEGWNKDEIQPGKTLIWLEALVVASNQKFLEWLYKVDFELLVMLFKKWLDVRLLEDDEEYDDVKDVLPNDTIDDQYYFNVKYPQYKNLIKSILNFLFETHNSFYKELMNYVISGLETEIGDLAYRFHRGRLEDNAIPDYAEAASIYRPLGADGLANRQTEKGDISYDVEAPIFAMMVVPKNDLLTEALAIIDSDVVMKTLQTEFAALANKIVVADELAPDIPDNLNQAADKSAAYVNLALEIESGTDVKKASYLLTNFFIEDLFRLAQQRVKNVYHRLDTLLKNGWLSKWPHGLNCLEPDWQEQAGLLLSKTPFILRRTNGTTPPQEDLIRTRRDLNQVEHFVQTITCLGEVFFPVENSMQEDWQALDFCLWKKGQLNYLESVTLSSMLFTLAATKVLSGKWQLAPLPVSKWNESWQLLSHEVIEQTLQEFLSTHLTAESLSLAVEYLEPVLETYRTELTSRKDGSPPDPRLVPVFLFTDY